MEQALDHARHNGRKMAVLFFDLDNFKSVNDRFGHAMGDAVLQLAASRLRAALREDLTVARLGGDEFVFYWKIFPADFSPEDRLWRILEDLRRPMPIAGQQIEIGSSAGLVLFPDDGSTREQLLSAADRSMYLAKHRAKRSSRRTL